MTLHETESGSVINRRADPAGLGDVMHAAAAAQVWLLCRLASSSASEHDAGAGRERWLLAARLVWRHESRRRVTTRRTSTSTAGRSVSWLSMGNWAAARPAHASRPSCRVPDEVSVGGGSTSICWFFMFVADGRHAGPRYVVADLEPTHLDDERLDACGCLLCR